MLTVPHEVPLVRGLLVRRRDRFTVDVVLSEPESPDEDFSAGWTDLPSSSLARTQAHCINPGRMEGLIEPGAEIWLQPSAKNATRKSRFTWELLRHRSSASPPPSAPGTPCVPVLCGTNTMRANTLVEELLKKRRFPGLETWVEFRSEKSKEISRSVESRHFSTAHCRETAFPLQLGPYSSPKKSRKRKRELTRLDFWVRKQCGTEHWIEVKNCDHVIDGYAYFPDSVSKRAQKHVKELEHLARDGHQVSIVFVVQRGDVKWGVRPSDFHDPEFAIACRLAVKAGVNFIAFKVVCSTLGYEVISCLPVDLEPYSLEQMNGVWQSTRSYTGWLRTFDTAGPVESPSQWKQVFQC